MAIYHDSSLLEIEIKTGRHHQIRRHFARSVNHLLGDRTYGKKKYNDEYLEKYNLSRIFLHSSRCIFEHPTQLIKMEIRCPLQSDLQQTLLKMTNDQEELLVDDMAIYTSELRKTNE
jgi:23S rRNA-/tRNA-specific pseudouridylate synthase